MSDELEIMIDAARAAGRVVMQWFGTAMEVTHKSPDQPLTQADLAANAALRAALMGARPAFGWLSEESSDDPARLQCEYVWIVDPIDGTRTFITGVPEFAISVALARGGTAIAGVVLNPATEELFAATLNDGAYVEREGERVPLKCRDVHTLIASRTELAAGELDAFRSWDIVPLGSTAYKMCAVAAGRGAFVSRGPKSEWDVCAADLIVREAGGVVSDLNGQAFRYNRAEPRLRGVVAAAPTTHAELLAPIRTLPDTERMHNFLENK